MRNKQYNIKHFRLSEKTIKNLEEIKTKHNLTWNLVFTGLIQLNKKHGLPDINKQIKEKSRRTKDERKTSIL